MTTSRQGGRVAAFRTLGWLAPCALLVAAPVARLAAQNPGAGDILDGAVTALGRATTLRADFTQYLRDPMLGSSDTSWGEFLRQQPAKFAFRWRHPAGDLIVADGQAL
jgi:hypothetical protein